MCGRFAITLPTDAMAQLFDAQPANDLPEVPNYNVCPTTQVHTVHLIEGQRVLRPMRWGFVPHWAKSLTDGPLLINARSETIAEKPAFRAAVRSQRCLIPATGFYEWTKTEAGDRLPWYIAPQDKTTLAFAGIWQDWGKDTPVRTCAIVTTAASADIEPIHHRMPVLIEPENWGLWLGEKGKGAAPLMKAAPAGKLQAYRVDPKVNSNSAIGPDLLAPLT
jgi:putative SOS response-associated peptidase YedK